MHKTSIFHFGLSVLLCVLNYWTFLCLTLPTCCTICIVYLLFRPQYMAIFRELPSIPCCIHHNVVLLHLGICSSVCKVYRLQVCAYFVCTNVLWKSNIKIYRRFETPRFRITNRHAVLKVCLLLSGRTIWEGFRIQIGLSEFTSFLLSAKVYLFCLCCEPRLLTNDSGTVEHLEQRNWFLYVRILHVV